jgi:hypothetical protein
MKGIKGAENDWSFGNTAFIWQKGRFLKRSEKSIT